MRWKSHVRCGAGEKLEIASKIYLSLFDCTLWKGVADNTFSYCKKGDILGVKGRLEVSSYEKDGETVYRTNVIAEKVSFLSSKKAE